MTKIARDTEGGMVEAVGWKGVNAFSNQFKKNCAREALGRVSRRRRQRMLGHKFYGFARQRARYTGIAAFLSAGIDGGVERRARDETSP
ncbi:hypothetical protein J6590_007273 [Homalodisca vitripennis]|nr:hypothetical protein J6590_007273 [Homalodisca vitripennis]